MATMTPNIGLQVPQIGASQDPQWEQNLVASLNLLDVHVHDGAGHGAKVLFNYLDVTTQTPNLQSNPIVGFSYVGMNVQGTTTPQPGPAGGVGNLAVTSDGGLWYVSPTTRVQLATASAISAGSTSGGFIGQYNTNGSVYFDTSGVGSMPAAIPASTYYFMAVTNGTPGVSAYGSIATNQIYLRGNPATMFVDMFGTGQTYDWQFGLLNASLGVDGLTGKYTFVNGGTNYSGIAFEFYETAASTALLGGVTTAFPTRVHGFHLNENASSAHDALLTSAAFSVYNVGGNANSTTELGYLKAIYASGSGAIAPSNGFGGRFRYRINTDSNATAVGGVPADAAVVFWTWQNSTVNQTQYAGSYRLQVQSYNGGVLTTTAFEAMALNAADKMAMVFGQSLVQLAGNYPLNANVPALPTAAIPTTAAALYFGMNAYFTGDALPLVNSAGPTDHGNLGSTTYRWTNVNAVNGNFSGTLTTVSQSSSSFTPTATATGPVNGAGGLFKNNQVLAYGTVSAGGVLSNSYGCGIQSTWGAGANAANQFSITLTNAIAGGTVVVSPDNNDNTNFPMAQAILTDTQHFQVTTISTTIANPAVTTAAAKAFNFVVIGQP